MPRVDSAAEYLRGSTYFTSLDLASRFHQIPMSPESREKTAFLTQEGLFEFVRMPFGLKCAPATFQRIMDIVLAGLNWRTCLVYLDDTLIFTPGTFKDHLKAIDEVLQRLRQHGLRAQTAKCAFAKTELTYLGHVVDRKGVRPDPSLVEAIANFPVPTSVTQVRSFLGYRVYIENFASVASPLIHSYEKDHRFTGGKSSSKHSPTLNKPLRHSPFCIIQISIGSSS